MANLKISAGIGTFLLIGGIICILFVDWRRPGTIRKGADVSVQDRVLSQSPLKSGSRMEVHNNRVDSVLAGVPEYSKADRLLIARQVNGMLASVSELKLSSKEVRELTDVTADMLAVCSKFRAEHAQVTHENGITQITISAQPDLGLAVAQTLQDRLAIVMGKERSAEVYASLGDQLTQFLGGYGAAEETYTYGADPQNPSGFFYKFDVTYPDSLPDGQPTFNKMHSKTTSDFGTSDTLDGIFDSPRYAFLRGLR